MRDVTAHDLVTADGHPIVWLSRLAGTPLHLTTGSDHLGPVLHMAARLEIPVGFLGATATMILGGIVGDRIGPLRVIWFSILGVLPFTLLLPHVGLAATGVLAVIIGLILASAFSAIMVYAQELLPSRVGMVAGLFFGFAFGVSAIASAALGALADRTGIEFVFKLCGYLPLLGLLTAFLPSDKRRAA